MASRIPVIPPIGRTNRAAVIAGAIFDTKRCDQTAGVGEAHLGLGGAHPRGWCGPVRLSAAIAHGSAGRLCISTVCLFLFGISGYHCAIEDRRRSVWCLMTLERRILNGGLASTHCLQPMVSYASTSYIDQAKSRLYRSIHKRRVPIERMLMLCGVKQNQQ
jgi:hypothetical protein